MSLSSDSELTRVIEQVHATPARIVLECAGAGSLALAWLHGVPGSSGTILEATDRYASASLAELLGGEPQTCVSIETASAMADRAYQRAHALAAEGPLLGVACTAAIATDRTKKGDHGCVVAVRSSGERRAYALKLAKGQRDRAGEERIVSRLIIRAIARACGLTVEPALELSEADALDERATAVADPLSRLLAGDARWISVEPDGQRLVEPPVAGAILSGSFDPLHEGHIRLAEAASRHAGYSVAFELPVVNADKGRLSPDVIERRLEPFAWRYPVILSATPLFHDKAALFPGCVFVVGFDTAERLTAPRYYRGEPGLRAALEAVRAAGCRLLVAGRFQAGAFRTLRDIPLPAGFEDLFSELPEAAFRLDISSTELRARMAEPGAPAGG